MDNAFIKLVVKAVLSSKNMYGGGIGLSLCFSPCLIRNHARTHTQSNRAFMISVFLVVMNIELHQVSDEAIRCCAKVLSPHILLVKFESKISTTTPVVVVVGYSMQGKTFVQLSHLSFSTQPELCQANFLLISLSRLQE